MLNITATNFAKHITEDINDGCTLEEIKAAIWGGSNLKIEAHMRNEDGAWHTYEIEQTLSDAELATGGDRGLSRAQGIVGDHSSTLEFDGSVWND